MFNGSSSSEEQHVAHPLPVKDNLFDNSINQLSSDAERAFEEKS